MMNDPNAEMKLSIIFLTNIQRTKNTEDGIYTNC
jgi:hypothetical protein